MGSLSNVVLGNVSRFFGVLVVGESFGFECVSVEEEEFFVGD